MKLKQFIFALVAMLSSFAFTANAQNVAKVGNNEYATINDAIAAWTNNTTLTLLADVTLSDVVTLKSTEHHILDLGTYTMTAASGKNAIVIKACGTGDSERTAITIKAADTNPGGINAGNKCVIYYKYADGGISGTDRPIIKIEGGVFTGTTSALGTAGIYTIGKEARKCATLNISGGTFNCSINGSGKSKLIVSGGVFNYSVGSQGDSTALRLISGGTFKTFGFMTADSNNTKFWFGTSMANSNVGVHVDDNGYIVVGGPVVTEAGDKFEASSTNYSGANSLLQYSSAKNNGLYYTSVKEAFADNNTASGKVTVYADEIDMAGISYKGTIIVPENHTVAIKNAPANLKVQDVDGNLLTQNANGEFTTIPPVAQIGEQKYATLADAITAAQNGQTITMIADVELTAQVVIPEGKVLTLDLNGKTVNSVFNGNSTTNHIYALSNKGTLTIEDSKGNGSINSRGIYNYGSLILNAGAINAIDGNGGYAVNNQSGSTFEMNGGVVAATNEDDHQSSSGGYDATALKVPAGCTATLNGGTINNVCDYTYAIDAAGTLNIPAESTITVNGTHGAIYVSGGETTINAGTFQIPADNYSRTDNVLYVAGGSLVVNGGTFIGDSDTASGGSCLCDTKGTAVVNGGTFKGSSGGDVWGTTGTTIKGGTFENLTEKQHIAAGYELGANGTVEKASVAEVNGTKYTSLADALAAAQAGSEIKLLANIDGNITVPAGVILNGNGYAISGGITAAGEITFAGVTEAASFNVENTNTVVNIPAGASLQLTGTDRMVIGHGCKFNITGTITDAKTANVADVTPSLVMPGASFTGAGVTFNVTNAYISAPSSYCSSSKSASGTFDFNITNSIWENAGKLAFESQSTAATVNFDLVNSVLNTGSHLVFGVSRGEVVIDNSNVNDGKSNQLENRSTMTIKNGSVVNGAVATSSNAINPGTIIVENATYAVTGQFSGAAEGTGTLVIKKGANVSVGSIKAGANVTVDAEGMAAGDDINFTANLSQFTGTLSVINNDNLNAKVVNGKIVLVERTLAGEGTEASPYLINNIADLKIFRNKVNAGDNYSGKFVKLNADIDLNNELWEPIGYMGKNFVGNFDGGNFTISNLTVTKELTNAAENNGVGLFGRLDSPATIKNLTIKNATVTGSLYVGAVVGYAYTGKAIENVTVKGNIAINAYWYAGVIGGNGYMNLVNNCHVIGNDGSYIKGNNGSYIGGIWGFRGEGANKITNCTVTNLSIEGVDRVGGISGMAHYGNTISDCAVKNTAVKATDAKATTVGLIAGACQGTTDGPSIITGSTVENVKVTVAGSEVVASLYGTNINGTTPVTNYVAKIGANYYESFEAAITAAQAGETVAILKAGTYALKVKDGITITGAVAGVEFANIGAFGCNGANVTFNNVTFTYAENSTYKGLQHSGNLVYNNCTFKGQVFLYGESEIFNKCTFVNTGDNYNVWTYGAANVAFNECTFSCDGKSVLVYTEGANTYNNVSVTKCQFNAAQAVVGKAAIEMDSSLSAGINLTIDGETTATGFGTGNVSGNSLWNNKKGNNDLANNDITVKVGDTVVLAPIFEAQIGDVQYRNFQDAIDAVQNGETITVLRDIATNVEIKEKDNVKVTIDGNGMKMTGTIKVVALSSDNDRRITIKNFKFEDTTSASVDFITSVETNHYPRITVEGCTFTGSGDATDVALRLKSSKNVEIKNCTGTGLHSFLQNTSGWNLTIENVTVTNSKSGLALGTVQGVTVKGCEIAAAGYGIRLDAGYNNNAVLESNKVEAFIPVVVRKATVDSNITVKGENEFTANNTDGIWCAVGTSEYEENGKMPTAATAEVKVVLANTNLDAAGIYGSYYDALTIYVGATQNSRMVTRDIYVATMDEAVAEAKAINAGAVIYKVYGEVELTTGGSHGILDLGKNVVIEGADVTAKLTIVGGGVPDIKGVTFKNIILADEGTYLPTANEFMYQNYIDCTFENVTFVDGIRLSGTSSITDSKVNANTTNEYAIWLDEGEFTMTGTTVVGGANAYGLVKSDKVSKITITDNTFQYLGEANKEALNVKEAVIIAQNNQFIDCVKGILPADKTNYTDDSKTTAATDAIIAGNNTVTVYYAAIGAQKFESLAAAFAAAQAGNEVVIFRAGTYSIAGITGKNLTITGAVAGVEFANIGAHNMGGANVTFNNVTFTYANNSTYKGLQHSGNLVYNNCTFNGQVFLYGQSETFNNCTFNTTDSNNYNVWTYGAKNVAFNECTFNSAGKSVLIYSEQASNTNNVTVVKSQFNASQAVEGKAAIEMDSSLSGAINLTIDGATTATGFANGNVSGNSLWNNKKGNSTDANNDITVKVGNETVLAPVTFVAKIGEIGFTAVADAIKAAQTGETVTIFAGEYTGNLNVNKGITVQGAVDAEGNNLVTFNGKLNITADGATVKNLNFNNSGTAAYVGAKNVTIDGCSLVGSNGLYQSYTSGTVTFKNSYIKGGTYGIHFDGKAGGNIVIEKCTVIGWTSFAKTIKKVTMTGTTFAEGNYNYVRLYQENVEISGCTFNEKMSVDLAVAGAQVSVSESTYGNKNIENLFASDDVNNCDIIVDGNKLLRVAQIGANNYATLVEAIAAAQDGDVIKLVTDITMDYGAREAFETSASAVVINGNGKTLTLNQTNSDWASFGLANNSKLVLKNMTIEKTGYGDTNGAWNTHAIIFSCPVKMTDVIVNNAVAVQAGAALTNVTINEANGYYGLWINGNGQTVTVNGGAINATNGGRGIKIADQYIDAPAQVTLTVDGTKFNTAKKAAVLVSSTAGAKIAATNVNIANVAEDSKNFVWVDEDWAQHFAKVEVTGATVRAESADAFTAAITANGAVQAYYKTLAEAINAAEAGATVELLADVTLAGGYTDAAEGLRIEKGITLNGNNHTIDCGNFQKGIRVYNEGDAVAIVNFNNVTIKNDNANGSCINTRTKNISLALNNAHLIAEGTNSQPLTIGGNEPAYRVSILKSTINAGKSGYGVICYVPVQAGITTGSNVVIDGFAAFYIKQNANNLSLNLGHGTYTGTNLFAKESGMFGTVVVEGKNNNITMTIDAATVKAVAGDDASQATQAAFLVRGEGNTINIKAENAQVNTEGKNAYRAIVNTDVAASTKMYDAGNELKLVAETKGYQFYSFEDAVRFAGNEGTIKIVNDFELADTWTIPAGKTVTLDLNGKTISQTKECTASYEMISNKGNLTITGNGKISFKDTSAGDPNFGWGSYTVRNEGNLVVENGTIEHLGEQAFGKHCIMALYQYSGSTTINGGTISTPNYRSARLWKGEMIINGGTFDGQVWVQAVDNTAKLTVNGGTFAPNGNDASAVFVTNNQYDVQFAVNDGTFNGKVGCSDAAKLANAITGGKFNAAAVAGTNVDLIAFGYEFGAADADGYQTVYNDESVLYIETLADLKAFRDEVNSGANYYAGVNVYLAADIDMTGENWVGIGSAAKDHGFMGNFDGKNFKIKNLTINNPALDGEGYAYAGLFGVTEGTDKNNQNTIKNLTIENVTINTTGQIVAAAIAYPYYTIVNNVNVCGDIKIQGGDYTAGVLAYTRRCVNASNLSVVGNSGSYVKGNKVVGGVISDIQTNGGLVADYKNFSAEGITVSGAKSVGAISGIISGQNLDNATVKNVELISQDGFAGIVAGRLGTASTVTNVSYENVTGAATLIGGGYDSAKAVQAKIGNTYYQTLEAALKAEGNEVVELLATYEVAAGETKTLDLNGKTVTMVYTAKATKNHTMVSNSGNLTIESSVEGGKLSYTYAGENIGTSYAANTITSEPGSVLTVKSGTIENLTFDSGVIAYAIDGRTNGGAGDVTVNIKGGVITSKRQAVRIFANSTTNTGALNISGGEFTGRVIVQNASAKANKAALNITGGIFNANDYKSDVLYVGGSSSAEIDIQANVAGGKFNGEITDTNVAGFISGGIYNNPVEAAYCATGFMPNKNTDGTYGVVLVTDAFASIDGVTYGSLKAAIAAAKAGETITLLQNVTENVTISKNLTIDGAGKTITGMITTDGKSLKVTIKNVNFDGNNKTVNYAMRADDDLNLLVQDCTASNYKYGMLYANKSNDKIVVKNVTVENCANYGAYLVAFNNATFENFTVNGDTKYGIVVANAGARTVNLKNVTFEDAETPLYINELGTGKVTFKFSGINDMSKAEFYTSEYVNVVAAAQVGTKVCGSLQDAVVAANDGETVKVLADVNMTTANFVTQVDGYATLVNVAGKAVTIDLNGKKVTVNAADADLNGKAKSNMLMSVFHADPNGTLTLTDSSAEGTGTVELIANDATVYGLIVSENANDKSNPGKIIVNGGNYIADRLADSMIFADINEVITVNGGNFRLGNVGTGDNGKPWIFNTTGQNQIHINVNGGTYNANVGKQYYRYEVNLGEGLTTTNNGDGTWTVVPGVATVGEELFGSIQEAIEAAQDGETVKLIADVAYTDADVQGVEEKPYITMLYVQGKNITLDLNGKNIDVTYTGSLLYSVVLVSDGAGLTVTGEGSIDVKGLNADGTAAKNIAYVFWKRGETGYLTIENGTFHMNDAADSMVYTNGDEIVTINGGTFILDAVASQTNGFPVIFSTQDNNERQIVVNGGTFNYDINHQIRPFEPYVAPEKAVKKVQIDGVDMWTIVPAQAYVTELLGEWVTEPGTREHKVGYATVAEAIAATNDLGKTVTILADEYTQNLNVNKAITVKGEVDAEGNNLVTFNGKLNITADGATVKNINFNNSGTAAYVGAKNVTIDGCSLVGSNGLYQSYTSGTVTFKNSYIKGGTYGIHFDGKAGGKIVIEKCTVIGWTSFAGTIDNVAISGTTFANGNYNQLRLYQNATITECTFNENMNIDWGSSNKTAEFTDCSVDGDKDLTEIISLANIATKGLEVTIDGERVSVAAKIDSKYYLSLQAAIDAATGGQTVTILSDIVLTEGVTVAADDNIFIDLNGKTITGKPAEAKAYAVITNRGTLTIQGNGSVVCDHTLAGSTSYAVNTITNSGSLTIDGATIENKSIASNQIGYAIDNNSTTANAKVTVVSGNVTVSGSNYYDGIRQFCNSTEKENWVVVNGGKVSSIWMQNPSDGATQNTKDVNGGVTIEGGEVTNLYLEPSANFQAAITAGHVGNVSYFQTADGRNLVQFVTGGTLGTQISEDFLAYGYQLTGNAAPYTVVKTGKRAKVTFIDGEFTEYTNDVNVEVGELRYVRKFSTAWTPFYVPFEVPVSKLAEQGLEVAYINGVRKSDYDENGEFDNNGFNMELIMIHGGKGNADGAGKKLKANYPYFVRSKSGIANMDITLENVNLYAAEEKTYDCTTFLEKYEITGNCRKMTPDEFESNNYIVGAEGWGPIHDEYPLNPFRFYMTVTSREDGSPIVDIRSMSIAVRGEELPDGTTVIYDVEAERGENDAIFDLSGRRVLKAEKGGIYIINGKKVLVK